MPDQMITKKNNIIYLMYAFLFERRFVFLSMRILILLFLSTLFACKSSNSTCSTCKLEVSETLILQAKKSSFPYCRTACLAKKKDTEALLQLVRFAYKTDDFSAIEHGIVFSKIGISLGDDFMKKFIFTLHEEHKILIAKMFDAAITFAEKELYIKEKLPDTFSLLFK